MESSKTQVRKDDELEWPGSFHERMTQALPPPEIHHSIRWLFLVAGIAALARCQFAARPTLPIKDSDAREQFERAVRMRTTLEGDPQRDRSLADYGRHVAAYHKVYLISTRRLKK